MCLTTDTLKHGGIQKKKNTLMGTIAQIFDAPLMSYDSLMSMVPNIYITHFDHTYIPVYFIFPLQVKKKEVE